MDFMNPWGAVCGSELTGGVLLALVGSAGWMSGSQVCRRTQDLVGAGSVAGVRKVLARLCDQGVVQVESQPPALLYRLNMTHLLTPYMVAVAELRQELLGAIRRKIDGWSIPARHACVFGSVARGTAGPHSDVDVFVVMGDGARALSDDVWRDQVVDLGGAIRDWTGNAAQVLDVDMGMMADMIMKSDPLLASIRQDHVLVAGHELSQLVFEIRRAERATAAEPR